MISEYWAFTGSERCYSALLSFYPIAFRVRFGNEMAQVFRDCCRDQLEKNGLPGLAGLWVRTIVDLALSVPRERRRAALYAGDLQLRTAGLIESMVLLAIISFHLLLAGTGIALYIPRAYETPTGFFFVAATAGAVLGGLGVLSSLVLARFRQINYRSIGL
jgi:hypothetical protein